MNGSVSELRRQYLNSKTWEKWSSFSTGSYGRKAVLLLFLGEKLLEQKFWKNSRTKPRISPTCWFFPTSRNHFLAELYVCEERSVTEEIAGVRLPFGGYMFSSKLQIWKRALIRIKLAVLRVDQWLYIVAIKLNFTLTSTESTWQNWNYWDQYIECQQSTVNIC